jgi:replicative DNA helicase
MAFCKKSEGKSIGELISQIEFSLSWRISSFSEDKFIRRSLIKLGYEAINSGYITNIPLENMLNDFENKLFNINNEIKTQKLFSSAELLNKIFFELKEKSIQHYQVWLPDFII